MKKIFNKFTKLLLTFILLFSDIAPLAKVFADLNPSLTIKASTSLEGEYDEIKNNTTYTFDQSTNIDNYYFKLNGNSFEESENYLIKTDINFYGEWDKDNVHDTKKIIDFKKGLSLNQGISKIIPYDYLSSANGIYEVNLSIYKTSDITLNGENLSNKTDLELEILKEQLEKLDMSEYQKVTNNSFKIEVINFKSGLIIDKVTYPSGEEVYKNDNIYEIDNTIDSNIDIKFHYEIGNLNEKETYHFNIYINGYLVDTYSHLTTQIIKTNNIVNIDNLINGNYNIELKLYDSKDNLVENDTIEINSKNSSVTDLNEYFILDEETLKDINKLRTKLINYKALNEEDKNALNEEIRQELESYTDKINNLSLDEYLNTLNRDLTIDSYYRVKDNEISIIYGLDGTFDKDLLISNQVLVSEFKEKFPNILISVYRKNGELASDDDYLETGMKVLANYNSLINEYYLIIRGNVISENGMITIEDIREMVSLGLGISTLGDEYYLASDVNQDNKVDILDATESYYILKNQDNIDTFNDYEKPTYQTENKIITKITSNKNSLRVGDTFKITLKIENLTDNAINGIQGILTFNNNLIKCKSVSIHDNWLGNINVINEDNYGEFMYLGDSTSIDGNFITFTFEALKEGSATVKVTDLLMALNGVSKELENKETNSVLINIARPLDNDARIKELKFDKGTLNKTFNKEIANYILYVDYFEDTININGILESLHATTSGFKEYKLNSNKTIIPITVIAENGNTKTYTIEVIKIDRRSNNTNLKELTIEGIDIEFDKDKLEYNIEVDYTVKRLDINAIAEHIKSVVVIEDSNLEVGQNKIIIKVKAENGDTKDYILNVTRKSEVKKDITKNEEVKGNNSRLLLVILIIATISFLLYLIFKDNDKDKEPKYNLKEKENKKETKEQNKNNNTNDKKKNKKW